jgi:hypothetical protein
VNYCTAMVANMIDELDPDLARLFAQPREPFAEDVFMAKLLATIERARRTRLRLQICAIAAVVVIVLINWRPAVDAAAAVVRFVGDWSPTYTEALVTPLGWAVSMLVGLWVVLRARPSRR